MLSRILAQLVRQRSRKIARHRVPQLECLSERITPAVTTNVVAKELFVNGDAANNTLVVSRTKAGGILLNNKPIAGPSGNLVITQITKITINGGSGNDIIKLSNVNGALRPAILRGGEGNDSITGGTSADQLLGGDGNDILIGGKAADKVFGDAGNDLIRWNNGDGNDIIDGGLDVDTVRVDGSNTLGDQLAIGANATHAVVQRANAGAFALDIAAAEKLSVNVLGGSDLVTVADLTGTGVTVVNLALGTAGSDQVTVVGTANADNISASVVGSALVVTSPGATLNITGSEVANDSLTLNGSAGDDTLAINVATLTAKFKLDGGDGNDTINGSSGADTLLGGADNDTITGNGGADTVQMGAGNDTYVWDAGDASDVIDGQEGSDTLTFNGSSGAEIFGVSANGSLLALTRNIGNVSLSTDNVEIVQLNVLGGADTVTVNGLSGTDIMTVNVDLGVNAAGDVAADVVTVNGTTAADVFSAAVMNSVVQVTGLTAQVNVSSSEAANDRLVLNGLGGNDTISGGALAAIMQMTLDGSDGNDTLNGGNGADTFIGGDGNDTVDGNGGNDTAFLGNGNDTFVWDPGDGSDIVEGQSGTDSLIFNGSASQPEIFAASSNGGRLLFTRNIANIVMDLDDVEILSLNALGNIDTITINDLEATDIQTVNINLGVNGAGDGLADTVTINGTVAADTFNISGSAGSVNINNGYGDINITNAEPANDTLTISTSGGNDLVSASDLANSSVLLTINGGADNDVILGSQGNDTINGENGDDFLFGLAGNDTFTGGSGTDSATGGAGTDIEGSGIESFTQ